MPNFNPPYLPQMGADSPQTKTIFLRVTRAIRCKGQVGVRAPKGGKPPNFRPPIFSKTLRQISPKSLLKAKRLSEVCKFVLWSKSDDQILRKTSHSFGVFGGFGAKLHPPAGN